MAGLTADQTISYLGARLRGYAVVCASNTGGVVANPFLIGTLGPGANFALKAAIALSIVAVAVISALPAQSIFDDVAAMRRDRVAEWERSHFMANWDATPIRLFVVLTIAFNAVLALVQIWALYSV